MKRIGIITLFAALFCFIVSSAAMAYSLLGVAPVAPNTSINFQFYDYEFWVDSNANHNLDYGDKIYGVYKINSIVIGGTSYGLGNQFLGGNFTYTVVNPPAGTVSTSYVAFKDAMNLYYNPNAPVDFNGIGWLGNNDISDYITYAGSTTPTVKLATFVPTNATANATFLTGYNTTDTSWVSGLTLASMNVNLTTQGPTLFGPVLNAAFANNWSMNSYLKYPPTISPTLSTTPTYQTTLTSGNFTFASSDPIGVTFLHPVPEPATIMLLGAGLLGLGSWGRKKTKKGKES